ncbi:hypothetical protein HDU76_009916, partial [Blyttiomyces sp. JEL0837]
ALSKAQKSFLGLGACEIQVGADSVEQNPKYLVPYMQQFVKQHFLDGVLKNDDDVKVVFPGVHIDSIIREDQTFGPIFRLVEALRPSVKLTKPPQQTALVYYLASNTSKNSHILGRSFLEAATDLRNFTQFGCAAPHVINLALLPTLNGGQLGSFLSLEGLECFTNLSSICIFRTAVQNLKENLMIAKLPTKLTSLKIWDLAAIDRTGTTITNNSRIIKYLQQYRILRFNVSQNRPGGFIVTWGRPSTRFPNLIDLAVEFEFPRPRGQPPFLEDLGSKLPADQFMRILNLLRERCAKLRKVQFGFRDQGDNQNIDMKGKSLIDLYLNPAEELGERLGLQVSFGQYF